MDQNQLRDSLAAIALQPLDLATLLEVTPRAVSMWLGGERSVPGPVAAYLDLLLSVTPEQRQLFIRRKLHGASIVRNGMYHINFAGPAGSGEGVLIIQNGIAYGSDSGGGNYDGICDIDPTTGMARLRLKCAMPAGSQSVLGPNLPYAWTVNVVALFNPEQDSGPIRVSTDHGTAEAMFRYMRPLPLAA